VSLVEVAAVVRIGAQGNLDTGVFRAGERADRGQPPAGDHAVAVGLEAARGLATGRKRIVYVAD
jgi:hypothetical protein